jgi:hypothetical protein
MKYMGLTLILIACGTIFLLWLYVDAAVRYPEIYASSGRDPVVQTVCACFLLVYLAGYLLFHRNDVGPWDRH